MLIPSVNHRMQPAEWGLLILLAFLWSWVFLLTRVALADMPPFTVVALRLGMGALVLHGIVYFRRAGLPTTRRSWLAFFGMGLLNNFVPFCLIAWGQTQIASGLAAILNATTPLFTVALAHFLTQDDRISPQRIAGIVLGLAGVVTMIGVEALHGLGGNLPAQLAILGAAISYAGAGIFGRRFRGQSSLVTATGQVTASALMVLPLAIAMDRPWSLPMPGVAAWAAVAAAALFCTAIGYTLYFHILAKVGATNLLLVTLLMPANAVLLGAVLLGERVTVSEAIGVLLIGSGLLVLDGRLARKLRIARALS